MKLLIALVLILSIAFNCNASFIKKNTNIKGLKDDICFPAGSPGINGFSTNIMSIGYNSYLPTPNGQSETSYYEENQMDVDFTNQRFFVNYDLTMDNQPNFTIGKFWAFTRNKTEYIYTSDQNGNSICYTSTMDYEITEFNLEFLTDCQLGATPCEVYRVDSPLLPNTTFESIIVDKTNCALTVSTLQMVSPSTSGLSMTNYFDFTPTSNPYKYILPSECQNPEPIPQNIRPRLLNLFAKN
ncbi:hypothetical protein ACTA71_006741 [Dictyostelium dimigraforme]